MAESDREDQNKSVTPSHDTTLEEDRPAVVSGLLDKLEAGGLNRDEQFRLSQLIQQPGVVMTTTRHESFSGPLPPADLLNQYDFEVRQVIVEMARAEQTHAHDMQTKSLNGAIAKDQRGQWLGCLIAVTGLAAAAAIAPHSGLAAGVIGTIDLFGMVALFVAPRILERRRRNESLEE